MAEGEFKAWEKYPDSYRLDHPDFGDVHKTTYAKGTIKEFEKVSDDPLKVRSMVKVEVEGFGMSDFIPLFFHPKKEYWDHDEEGVKATDFNKEEKYFEQAWMSFRAEDEVRVMLREGKPYAVVGFDDGKPRIGEDVVKVEYQNKDGATHSFQWQFSKGKYYGEFDEEKKGPDGLDLYLKEEVPKLLVWSKSVSGWPVIPHWNDDRWNVTTSGTVTHYYHEWRVPVGGLLYIIQVLSTEQPYLTKKMIWVGEGPEPDKGGTSVDEWAIYYSTDEIIVQVGQFKKDFYEEKSASNQVADPFEVWNGTIGKPWWNEYEGFKVISWLVFERIGKPTFGYVRTTSGFAKDPRLDRVLWDYYGCPPANSYNLNNYDGISTHGELWGEAEFQSRYWNQFVPLWSTAKFYVRPHDPEK
jgi:hypothetical protein